MATTTGAKVSLKLLIDTKAKRVLFAEAGKDFVDFLFNILHLPVGIVVRLLTEQAMFDTLGKLYESIENLSETYFHSKQIKDYVLKPTAPFSATQVPLLPLEGGTSSARRYYTCSSVDFYSGHICVSENTCAVCRNCKNSLSREMQYVPVGEGGFVKGVVTYMVTDDLEVTPASPISGITMLMNRFNVKDMGTVEERVVELGMPEGLKLLKASLQSKTVLTSVFIENTAVESPPMLRWEGGFEG